MQVRSAHDLLLHTLFPSTLTFPSFLQSGATASTIDVSAPSYPVVNLTSSIVTSGIPYVTTASPTISSNPFVITYDVEDSAGNSARTVTRRVFVICPGSEFICPSEGGSDSLPQCSVLGICGLSFSPAASPLISFSNQVASTATPSVLTNYSITLNGPKTIIVSLGTRYRPCVGASNIECDLGATATLLTPGDYTNSIVACQDQVPLGSRLQPYPLSGLSYCSFNTSLPGNYSINYNLLVTSSPSSLVVTRSLLVLPQCQPGEYLCGLACCELATRASSSGNSSSNSESLVSVSSAPIPAPSSASTTLVLSSLSPSDIKIKKGAAYSRCVSSEFFSTDGPCETGAIASDPNDSAIQSRILMCPSSECRSSAALCEGQRFQDKQPSDCGFDSSMAIVGSLFQLEFMVFDSNGMQISVNRTLTVTSPCSSQQYYCSNECSNVSVGPAGLFLLQLTLMFPSGQLHDKERDFQDEPAQSSTSSALPCSSPLSQATSSLGQ